MGKDIEMAVPLVAHEYRLLIEGYGEIKARSESGSLTDEERYLLHLKLLTIEGISLILELIEDSSKRNKVLLVLCLSGEKCSSRKYMSKEFKSQAALRAARNQFRFLLASTLFKSDKIEALLKSESRQEVEEVVRWFNTVFDNSELKRYCDNSPMGGHCHEA
ncbi:hypothetical protein PCCS19_21010 [Paenibacillus sp. CCS19]|uniref:hypothetical protein n=1 Tax=Paenibacillus sp. CCS19 TaxID=3158387 RepID=UPI00256D17FF|nr:hypothetical protein [Paenibacillus cellulosilyticus]GMK39047.1 hypothetical protein PCCS19_21010 [Paenibacillus cellulosilyticus]